MRNKKRKTKGTYLRADFSLPTTQAQENFCLLVKLPNKKTFLRADFSLPLGKE
jgi:hypothetical protein